ncbi:MAG: ATP-binding protein [Vicinamibacterales bacterium]|nr:ATP-binding protein [Vicinamibacterales bacterium]
MATAHALPITPPGPSLDFRTLDLLPYGIIVVDMTGEILFYNEREEHIAARRRHDVLGRNFFTTVAPCTQVASFQGRFDALVARRHETARFEFHFPLRHGPRDVEVTLTPFEHQGRPLCLIAVNDLTEQDQLRSRVLDAERFRELGEVAAGVSHNFGNLLQVIRGTSELLLLDELPDSLRAHITTIHDAAADGTNIVRRMRQVIARQSVPAAFTPVDLGALVTATAEWALPWVVEAREARGATVEVRLTACETPAWTRGVPSELREVVLNLVRNGIDAIEDAGVVTVGITSDPDVHDVTVRDTGCGMAPDVLAQLFRPFFTTKGARGSGFGLATAFAIAQAHGGRLQVESAPGAGSTFHLRLPVAPSGAS